MDSFLDKYHIPKLNQEQTNNLNRRITPKEIEVVIKSLKNSTGPDGFFIEFCQNFKEELIPILLKLLHKRGTEGTKTKYFFEATVTLIPNHTKTQQ